MLGLKTIQQVDKKLKADLKTELSAQGHHLTGALEESIASNINESTDVTLEVKAKSYIDPLNSGVPAANIPYDPLISTGAKTSKYIQGLKQFAKLRFGLDDKEALNTAFAIANKHKQEGMPTKGSYAFSNTGKRTEVIEETYHRQDYDNIIEVGLSDEIDDKLGFSDLTIL